MVEYGEQKVCKVKTMELSKQSINAIWEQSYQSHETAINPLPFGYLKLATKREESYQSDERVRQLANPSKQYLSNRLTFIITLG